MTAKERTEIITLPFKDWREYFTFKLNLNSGILEDFVTIAAGANMSPEELLEEFVEDLCENVNENYKTLTHKNALWDWMKNVYCWTGKTNSFVKYAMEHAYPLNIYENLRRLEQAIHHENYQDRYVKTQEEWQEDLLDSIGELKALYCEYAEAVPDALGFRDAMEQILDLGNRVYRTTEDNEILRFSNKTWDLICEMEELKNLKEQGRL